jgi:hypothetical protein
MSVKHFAALAFVVMALATSVVAQDQAASQDPWWAPVRSLEGVWKGEGMETMSARMTLRFLDAETYEMVLELGTKGKELKPCQTMKLRRVN